MLETLAYTQAELPWFFPMAVFVFGAIVGSFLNVCIYRIPEGRSVVSPGSHCACGQPIAWYDNLPILSWLFLRGKARCCGRSFSFRYAGVEALTGGLFLAAWLRYPPLEAFMVMLLIAGLVAATFIDIDHMIIPDRFSIGWMLLGLVCSVVAPGLHHADPASPFEGRTQALLISGIGVLIGSGVVLWILILAEAVLKKEAMGFGDVKLLGAIGAFCGWQGALFSIFGGAILGTVYVLFAAIWQRTFGKAPAPEVAPAPVPETAAPEATLPGSLDAEAPPDAGQPIGFGQQMPFGPMLAGGAVLYILWLKPWFDDYLGQMEPLFK